MKVLTIFIDMIRANRLSTFNSEVVIDTPLDVAFKDLGGTVYTNCFVPGPDTPRGMSTFYTGLSPLKNGCNTRLKWPQYFLNEKLPTIFDLFTSRGFELDCFTSPKERDNGLFPRHVTELNVHNEDLGLRRYLSQLNLTRNHFVFVSIPDYHWSFDDFGYSTAGERRAYQVTKSVFDIVFENLNKDDFDHIFIFSDHGFKFNFERKSQPKAFMLDEDRTNSIMLHRFKGQERLKKNDKLCSLADLYATYQEILGDEDGRTYSLLTDDEREYVVLEDHINFAPSINQNIELWGLVNKKKVYIRELHKATLIDRRTRSVSEEIVPRYDEILKQQSSFDTYMDEYEKIFRYRENILSMDRYMNGRERKKTGRVKRFLDNLLDKWSY